MRRHLVPLVVAALVAGLTSAVPPARAIEGYGGVCVFPPGAVAVTYTPAVRAMARAVRVGYTGAATCVSEAGKGRVVVLGYAEAPSLACLSGRGQGLATIDFDIPGGFSDTVTASATLVNKGGVFTLVFIKSGLGFAGEAELVQNGLDTLKCRNSQLAASKWTGELTWEDPVV